MVINYKEFNLIDQIKLNENVCLYTGQKSSCYITSRSQSTIDNNNKKKSDSVLTHLDLIRSLDIQGHVCITLEI